MGLGLVLGPGPGLVGCGVPAGGTNDNNINANALWPRSDAGEGCDPDLDDDEDGVPNGVEGCDEHRDTDGDGVPDWLDNDSDNDGCADGDEDLNGDGLVGDCQVFCPNLDPDGCGMGQLCLASGICDPPTPTACASPESDPHNPDTNVDGLPDCVPVTTICEPQSIDNPLGRPAARVHTSPDGKLQIAVWEAAVVQDQTIVNLGAEDCDNGTDDNSDGAADCDDAECHNTSGCFGASVTFDLPDPNAFAPTAGFAFSRRPLGSTVEEERTQILQALDQLFGSGNVTLRHAGEPLTLLNQVPSIVQITVNVDTTVPATIPEIRNHVVITLLRSSPNELINLPTNYFGFSTSEIVISFAIQRRTPTSGDPYIAVMGAVTSRVYYDDPQWITAQDVADAANGTGLADPSHTRAPECEERLESTQEGRADILWIIDDSSSTQAVRQSLFENAPTVFNEAASYGLDFRMGVTNMHIANNGILCTAQGQSNDFFLDGSQLAEFQACLLEPSGSLTTGSDAVHGITQGDNAILNHLPRAMAPNRIRPNANLVMIFVSDDAAQEVITSCGSSPPWDSACIQTEIQPTLNLLMGVSNPEAKGTAHAIVGPPPSGCSTAELGGGYIEIATATGGQIISVCQSDFGAMLHSIFLNIMGFSAQFELYHHPISTTLVVARDGVVLPRSRTDGFSYRVVSNTIIFAPTQDSPPTSELVISYERWVAPQP